MGEEKQPLLGYKYNKNTFISDAELQSIRVAFLAENIVCTEYYKSTAFIEPQLACTLNFLSPLLLLIWREDKALK